MCVPHKYGINLYWVILLPEVGANMTLHRNIKPELLPSSRYDKVPKRWRGQILPPLGAYQDQYEPVPSERGQSRQSRDRQADYMRPTVSQENNRSRGSAHLEVRPPSAHSASIVLRRKKHPDWLVGQSLDTARVSDCSFSVGKPCKKTSDKFHEYRCFQFFSILAILI